MNKEKIQRILKVIFLSKRSRTFYWTTVNGFIVVVLGGLADLDWAYIPVLIAMLSGITKHINREYLS